jgi:hypothetical protein
MKKNKNENIANSWQIAYVYLRENMISKYNKRQPVLSFRISKQTNQKMHSSASKKIKCVSFLQRALRGVRNGLPTKKAYQ